jgi:hypothetical protein
MSDLETQVALRLPETIIRHADELARMGVDAGLGEWTRSSVLRIAIREGLHVLQSRVELVKASMGDR